MSDADQTLSHIRHSLAHLLAAAVKQHDEFKDAKLTLGPSIDTGFYYDIDFGDADIGEDDLDGIEDTMESLVKEWTTFQRFAVTAEEARNYFKDNEYKLELIDEIEGEDEEITLYYSGPDTNLTKDDILTGDIPGDGFVDLCRGGHIENPSEEVDPGSFVLDSVAGAYWRGDEENDMLTRIYGLAFESADALDNYLQKREEARKRDHRKVGKQLDLFVFSELVGSGLPLWTPKGRIIRDELHNHLLAISKEYGVQPVRIPHLGKQKLYETSGHAEKFKEELLQVQSNYTEFALKPVNCPHHTQIYDSQSRSYRDLPIRYMETTMQYRDEKPGEIGGLTRVRSITVDDGHIFCRPDQIKQEAKNIAHIIERFYEALGLFGDHWVSLSVRDPANLDDYIGDDEDWDQAESMLADVSDELQLDAERIEGEAAIYGPKLDYMFEDSLGREWQLATIQIDFAMPKRFELTYTTEENEKATPVMIHRAILGSYERFMAVLIEHFGGDFPLWLAPEQVRVLPISDDQKEYANEVHEQLKDSGLRAAIDASDETLGKKIRNLNQKKVPYFIVIGDDEVESGTVTLEDRTDGTVGMMNVDEVCEALQKEITNQQV